MKESKIIRSDAEWKKLLTPEQYRIAREKGTEVPFTGQYFDHTGTGAYSCAACGQVLFRSDSKFDAGCGWPSFYQAAGKDTVKEHSDTTLGMVRTEVVCSRCGAHLGHVFNDGPNPTGLRYCINSGILAFQATHAATRPEPTPIAPAVIATQKVAFAAGCFWGVEAEFRKLDGVLDTAVGYTGGHTTKPTYREVCTDSTGHAEAVEVMYDPSRISFEKLLEVFWAMHDPTQINRQGPDHGSQYRSAIFHHTAQQQALAAASKKKLSGSRRYPRPIATSIEPAGEFWRAEEYHQRYVEKRGGPSCHR